MAEQQIDVQVDERRRRVAALVARIVEHQAALKLSNAGLVARFQTRLSSVDTWRRLRESDWDGMGARLDKWEGRLTALCADLDGSVDITEFFAEMPIARYGSQAYEALQGQRNDRRVAWLVGPTGVGKSWTMRHICERSPRATSYCHAAPSWRDSMLQISRGLAKAIGATEEPSGAATFGNVVEMLKAHPATILIDDLHDGGVLILRLVKNLVDDTRAKFILGTYPTAWAALLNGSSVAQSEAQQLLGRSIKPLRQDWVKGLTADDCATYVRMACGIGATASRALGERIAPLARQNGNLRVLADAIETARLNADLNNTEIDADLVDAAVAELCPKRGGEK